MSIPFARPIKNPFEPSQGWFANRVTRKQQHQGMDFRAPEGRPVYAIAPGVIVVSKDGSETAGNYIVIKHTGAAHEGFSSRYLHLSRRRPGMRVGREVTFGELIGYSGNTGLSDAPHLHMDMQASPQLVAKLKGLGLMETGRTMANTAGVNVPVEQFIDGTGTKGQWVAIGGAPSGVGGLLALAAVALLFA